MKSIQKLFCLFSLAWYLTGCASAVQYANFPVQTKSIEDPDKARIYVLRPSNCYGDLKIPILEGNTSIGYATGRSFLSWERKPGKTYIFSWADRMVDLPITVEKGEVYYIG